MKLWTCTDHDSVYPIGVASIVLAEDKEQARRLLARRLRANGLNPDKGFTLTEIHMDQPRAIVLRDGNY